MKYISAKGIFVALSVFFIFISILNIHSSFMVRSYKKTYGEISNVQQESHLTRSGRRITYTYIISWKDNGQIYHKETESIYRPEEGYTVLWVSPDNKNAVTSNEVVIRKEALLDLIIGLLLGLGSFCIKSKEKTYDRNSEEYAEYMQDMRILFSILLSCGCFLVSLIGLMFFVAWKNSTYIPPQMADVMIFGIGIIIAVFWKLRKLRKQKL